MGKKPIDLEEILKAKLEVTALLSEDFAKEKNIVALNKSENSIIVVMSDPEDISTLDAVKKLTNLNPEIFISGSNNIKKALDILYGKIKKSGEVESAISSISIVKGDDETGEEVNLEKEEVSAEDAPFVKLVNLILLEAIKLSNSLFFVSKLFILLSKSSILLAALFSLEFISSIIFFSTLKYSK